VKNCGIIEESLGVEQLHKKSKKDATDWNLEGASRRKKEDRQIEDEEELTSVEGKGLADHGKRTRQGKPISEMKI
jgi:hypothetical protein